MVRGLVFLMLCVACLGCERSADSGQGFDQALKDMKGGVQTTKEVPSEEYRQGYREAVEKIESAIRESKEHTADQKRAQELHERMFRK